MRRSFCLALISILIIIAVGWAVPAHAHHLQRAATASLPVTSSSPEAGALYQKGITELENLYVERAVGEWRAAVKADPNFGLAWAWIAFESGSPEEAATAREKAQALAPKLTPGEQLLVSWIVKIQEGDFIGGISAMNDMLEMYPKDKHLLYFAGNWVMDKNGNEQALRLFGRALAIDKNFPAVLNDVAYVQARERNFDKAFAAMERYAALLPNEPNPQDSYGEILRMAGNFEGSLQHYRAALKIDPDFVTSQVGLGDTYALMGKQELARIEYDKAIRYAHNEADRLTYCMQRAMTWVREGDFAEADKKFQEIADTAHAKEQDLQEAVAYRHLAEYQSDDNAGLRYLQAAEEALSHRNIARSDKDEELSHVLRTRVVRAARAGDAALADNSLKQLEALANSNRNRVLQCSYNGAAGTLLMEQKKYEEAIPHLEEDRDNPLTLELLVQAYYQTNQSEKLHEAEAILRGTNVPTMEQALVVPAARSRRPEI
ncbi:MAG: tetratricopeptide repeat protein [Candidatus Sulfotelmatobacter sp.]|jgi:tetratricopeptide (TPR) repeat protein